MYHLNIWQFRSLTYPYQLDVRTLKREYARITEVFDEDGLLYMDWFRHLDNWITRLFDNCDDGLNPELLAYLTQLNARLLDITVSWQGLDYFGGSHVEFAEVKTKLFQCYVDFIFIHQQLQRRKQAYWQMQLMQLTLHNANQIQLNQNNIQANLNWRYHLANRFQNYEAKVAYADEL